MNKVYDPDHYKIVFFSSAPIWVPFLEELNSDPRFEVVWVVTQCDKPSGRGLTMCENIIKTCAKWINTKDKIQIIDYDESYSDRIAKLYDKCFNNELFGKIYNYDYCFFWLKKRCKKESYIWRILLVDGKFAWYYQGFETNWLLDYFSSSFNIDEIESTMKIHDNNISFTKDIFRLDDIFIEEEYRWKGYFDLLLQDLEEKIVNTNKKYFWIYVALDEKLISKYEKRWFVKNWICKNLTNDPNYMFMSKRISHKDNYISTPTKLNPEKSEEWKQFYERLKNKEPDFLVVIAYGKIIPQAILDIPKLAPINIHGSLLPKYRWASPIQSCLLNKDTETWITIMKMDATMDTWNMIEKIKFQIPLNRTSEDIIKKMQETWPKFLGNVLRKYGKRLLWEEKQDNDKATYCEKMEKEDWLIDPFTQSLDDIYAKYRAFYLRPKIYFHLPSSVIIWKNHQSSPAKRVIVEKITVDENKFEAEKTKSLFISSLTKEGVPTKLVVDSLNPCITEILLKPEWKKAMPLKEFLNWYLK